MKTVVIPIKCGNSSISIFQNLKKKKQNPVEEVKDDSFIPEGFNFLADKINKVED